LFLPAITDENGYRYYSYHQFDTFSIITILKELNVLLKDIKIYLNTRTPEMLLSLAEQKIDMANREIDKLNQIKNLLEDTIICTNLGLNADCDIITLENQEEEYMFLSTLLNGYRIIQNLGIVLRQQGKVIFSVQCLTKTILKMEILTIIRIYLKK